jgi:hypothetical protein
MLNVHKLRIVSDPKIHYDLLRFCQHTRLAFLARNLPPDVMMRPVDVNFDPGRCDWGSGILQQNGLVPASALVRDSIVLPILQRGLDNTFATLSGQEMAWCRMVVELPDHQGGLGIDRHYASAVFGNGSFLQRDCSNGLLAGLAPSRLSMVC